jgi:hypothetical protein
MHARSRIALTAVAGLALCVSARTASSQQVTTSPVASPAVASQALAPRTPRADVAAPTRTTGPTVDAARVGVTQEATQELTLNSAAQQRRNLGQPVALMVVGGAALLTGLIIGDDAGTVIAIGGALVGLYGLYEYLQ